MKVTDPDSLCPTGFHILLKTEEIETVSSGGIIQMTQGEEDRQQTGNDIHEVVAMGPDCYKNKEDYPGGPWCKVGDIVITPRYVGHKIEIDGGLYWFANEDNILATLE